MTLHKARLNGVDLAYRIDGEAERPWLILSNSIATDHGVWAPQIEALARSFRVVRYDTRGHGASSAPPGPYGFGDLAGDVVALMDHLGIAQSTFVGISLGGMTGLGLALDHPNRFDRFVCADARADAPDAYKQIWRPNIDTARAKGMAALVEPTLQRWFSEGFRADPSSHQVLSDAATMISRTSVEGYAGCANALMSLDFLPRLHTISVPSLFIVGEHDPAAPVAVMKDMSTTTPGSSFTVIENAAHLANLEQPDAFNAAFLGWLEA